jgi:hypothetical protein
VIWAYGKQREKSNRERGSHINGDLNAGADVSNSININIIVCADNEVGSTRHITARIKREKRERKGGVDELDVPLALPSAMLGPYTIYG